jgi:transcriptional regulator with XRE-family HTH domain
MSDHDSKLPAYFGMIVSELRKHAGLKQSEVAQKLTVDASRISRIESGEVSLNSSEAEALLKAIGTQNAEDLQEFLNQGWEVLERPYFHHPERDALYDAELTLQKLSSFYKQKDLPTPLYGEAKMHEETLLQMAKYLMPLRHSVAYIGDIGVGKTTAVCIQTGLSFSKSDKANLPTTALETGAGGTTVCEVRIRKGLQYSLLVEPMIDAEIYKLAGELCAGIYDSSDIKKEVSSSEKESQAKGVSREIDRALRNMTGLTRRRQKHSDGKMRTFDPLKELAEKSESLDDLCSEFNQRLSLWKRSRREVSYDDMSETSELEWLQRVFMDINNGRHEDFSLPKRIDIFIPFNPLSSHSYEIEVIDTKGVDQTAIRPDLQACIDDPRAIIILCSRFNDAPGTSTQSLIEHLNKTGQSSVLGERMSILVLPRPMEAIAMKDDSGEQAQEDEDGYGMKSEQVEMLLKRIGAENIPLHFFNYVSDDPQNLNGFIIDHLRKLRGEKIDRISAICSAVDYLVKNQEQEYVRVSQNEVSKRLKIFLTQYSELSDCDWRIEEYLRDEIRTTHARTVWASVRREGSWGNLDVHFTLGYGARVEARKCTEKIFYGLREIVQNMLGDKDLEPSHVFLNELDSNWLSWYNNFLNRVQKIGNQIFRNSLDNHPVWIECSELYGQQKSFRDEVASKLNHWFRDSEQEHLYKLLESRIREMWKAEVLGQLSKFVDEE